MHIVSMQWLEDSIKNGVRMDESSYSLVQQDADK